MSAKTTKLAIYSACAISIAIGIVIGRFWAPRANEGHVISLESTDLRHEARNADADAGNTNNAIALSGASSNNWDGSGEHLVRTIASEATSYGNRRANEWMEDGGKADEEFLLELGLDKERISEIQAKRAQLASLSANDLVFRLKLQGERLRYLDIIKQNTDPEEYQSFLEYEKTKPARREFEVMGKKGIDVAARLQNDEKVTLENLMVELGLVTTESWEGPLDPLPNPMIGKKRAAEHVTQELNNLNSKLPELMDRMQEGGFSSDIVDDVHSHYVGEMERLQRIYDSVMLPDEDLSLTERMARLRENAADSVERQNRHEETAERLRRHIQGIKENSGNH